MPFRATLEKKCNFVSKLQFHIKIAISHHNCNFALKLQFYITIAISEDLRRHCADYAFLFFSRRNSRAPVKTMLMGGEKGGRKGGKGGEKGAKGVYSCRHAPRIPFRVIASRPDKIRGKSSALCLPFACPLLVLCPDCPYLAQGHVSYELSR